MYRSLAKPAQGTVLQAWLQSAGISLPHFTPVYISLEYVLQRAGVIFQYDSRFTMITCLSRELKIEGKIYSYRKIKNELLVSQKGIVQQGNTLTIATPERAFLDMLYLNGAMYFDNLRPLKKELIEAILPVYNSKTLEKRVTKILKDHGLS